MKIIQRFHEIEDQFDAIICDVWGVIHNGVELYPGVRQPLKEFKANGKPVILLTNAPRPSFEVKEQLAHMGLDDTTFDDVVTSGDVTQELIAGLGSKGIFHLGPERDLALLADQKEQLVSLDKADAVVCTGLFDDTNETPDDYNEMLREVAARKLPFITANPDLVVDRGGVLIHCAGGLAKRLGELGGNPILAGKPYAPAYDRCINLISNLAGKNISKDRIICIGDGLPTDVKGALNNDFPCLFIFGGIHKADVMPNGKYDANNASMLFDNIGKIPSFGIDSLI